MSAEVKLSTRNALRVLRPGPFRRYIIGSAISDTGTWMQVMTQGWVMATLTTSALMLGLVQLCAGLPMLALTMIGGSTADKFDKRKILLITQYIQIAIAVSIGLLIWRGKIAIGGYLVSAWGLASAFFANAISFIALIVAILSLPPRLQGTKEEEEKRMSGIKEGFRYVASDKPSLAMIVLIATQSLCIFPIITVMMPLYVRLVLHLGADKLGTLMGASAIGSVVGSIFLIGLPREKRVPLMMICATAVTLAVTGLSRAPSFYVAMALLIVNSLGLATNFGLCSTIVQERAPDYLRGRVSAVFMLSFVGLMPIAGLGVTSLSDLIGMPTALVIAAICYGAVTLLVLARFRKQCCEPALSESQAGETPPPIAATI